MSYKLVKFLRLLFVIILFEFKDILKEIKERLKCLDNERLAIIVVLMLGLALLLPLCLISSGLLESEWFLVLLSIPAGYGGIIADGAYIGRLCNLWTAHPYRQDRNHGDEKTKLATILNKKVIVGRRIGPKECWLTSMGMFLGVGLAILCIVLHFTVPFFSIFSYFAYILFILGYACTAGGLFNRIGSSLDGTRLPREKKAILFGTVVGLGITLSLVVILFVTGSLPFVMITGISQIFFDLFALHKALFTFSLILMLTSLTTSFFDYSAKAGCFLTYLSSSDQMLKERVESRLHEYRGAFLGMSVGCLVAVGIVTGLVVTGSLVAAPVAIAATIFATVVTCNSVFPALFSRVGRVIDGFQCGYRLGRESIHAVTNTQETLLPNENFPSMSSIVTLNPKQNPCHSTPDLRAIRVPTISLQNRYERTSSSVLVRTQSSPAFFNFFCSKEEPSIKKDYLYSMDRSEIG